MSGEAFVHYHVEAEPLAGVPIEVQRVEHFEALNEPFRLELELSIGDPDFDAATLLGKDFVLEIRRNDRTRRVVGLARHIVEGDPEEDAQGCSVVVVPALWMLGLRRNTKIFQEMTVPEILDAVMADSLSPYDRTHELELQESYPRLEYCVQYQETDLDFVQRLMEEHGISYAFDHEGEREILLLRDRNASFPPVPNAEIMPVRNESMVVTDVQPVYRFHGVHRETTTSTVVRDWDWTKAGDMKVEGEERGTDAQDRDRESYEHGEGRRLELWDYAAGARVYQQANEARQAVIRRQMHSRDVLVGKAVSGVVEAAPGHTFELTGHPMPGFDGQYLITRVLHLSAPLDTVIPGAGSDELYVNQFECIPLETEYRPDRRTQKPRIPGVQTAVVTGPSGEEIHTDEHGRIKVQFHWDRDGQRDENSSCWIRVQQPWAGPSWGFWYLPRIGMEVVVHFVDGDPDRPLVSGCVYNGTNLPPYPLPDEKTKSTIKSNSSLGGDGFNELRFEDKAGSEEIYTHAQKDYNEVVENDHTTLVHHDQTNTVDNDQTQLVKHDQTETVKNDQSMTIDGSRTVHVMGDYDETVDGTETRNVKGDVSETFSANETRTVSGDLTETIGGNETRAISANQTETISGSHTSSVSGNMTHSIGAALTQTVLGGVTQETPATYTLQADGGLTVVAPAGVELNAGAGIMFGAPGGVQHIDTSWDWIGMFNIGSGGTEQKMTLFKVELITHLVLAAVGFKMEQPVLTATATGVTIHTRGLALLSPVTLIKFGAVEVESGPECSA